MFIITPPKILIYLYIIPYPYYGDSLKVIVTAGMPGCGKDEFVKIAKEKGIPVIRMGDIVREEARKQGLELTDEKVGGLANKERLKLGFDIWAKRTVLHVKEGTTLIDGCRGDAEVRVFREKFGKDLVVIAVHSSPKTRFERLTKRGRDDDPKTYEEFLKRDERELGWGIGNVIATADHMMVNEGSMDEFSTEVRQLFQEILGE